MFGRMVAPLPVLSVCVVFGIACGGDDGGSTAKSPTTGKPGTSSTVGPSSTGEKNDRGESVNGQLQLSGKLSGTFTWNKELAVTWCALRRVGFTMTDGKDTFISIESAKLNDGTDKSTVGSAKTSGIFTGKSATVEGKETPNKLGASGTVTWANTEFKNAAGDSITVNGKLTFNCP